MSCGRGWPWWLPVPASSPTSAPPHQVFLSGKGRFGEGWSQSEEPTSQTSGAAGGVVRARCEEAQVRRRAGCPGEVAPPGPPTPTGFYLLSPGCCRGRAGHGSRQQEALAAGPAATTMLCSVARDQHSALGSGHHICALLCGAVEELGFKHSPVPSGTTCWRQSEETWTRTCLPLGPPALHGTFQGQPQPLNTPNYLCSCCFLGEPEGLG